MRNKRIAKRVLGLALTEAGLNGICSDILITKGYMMHGPSDGDVWYYPHGDCADARHGQHAAEIRISDETVSVRLLYPDDFVRYHQRDEYHNRRIDGDLRDQLFVFDMRDWIADQGEMLDIPPNPRTRTPKRDSNPRPRVSGTFGTSRATRR